MANSLIASALARYLEFVDIIHSIHKHKSFSSIHLLLYILLLYIVYVYMSVTL